MAEQLWKSTGGDPGDFLSWLYRDPGKPVREFTVERYEEHINTIGPELMLRITPPYDTFDWDVALDELRDAGLITGSGWEDLHPTSEQNDRYYPAVPGCVVHLTTEGRKWVEERGGG